MKKNLIILILILPIYIFANSKILISAPATPSSIPLILAVEKMENTEIQLFSNHSKAHSLFLKDQIQILSTGLTVGKKFHEQKIPLKIINSYVSGLTYLVTSEKKYQDFSELKGEKIYVPFKGSPIDEITKFFLKKENQSDIEIGYSVFPTSMKLLKMKRIKAAIFPEPFVSMLEKEDDIFVSMNYSKKWNEITKTKSGYPQVGTFAKKNFIKKNPKFIEELNKEIKISIADLKKNPEKNIKKVLKYYKFPQKILESSLKRIQFNFIEKNELEFEINNFYKTLGKPLDETFKDFF